MSKYNFVERFQRLVDRKCILERTNASLYKEAAKYRESLENLKQQILQDWEQLNNCKRANQQLGGTCLKQRKFIESENQILNQMAREIQTREEQLMGLKLEDESNSDRQLVLYCLRKCTNIFTNLETLPEFIQGISKCEKEDSSQLVPFQIKASQHTNYETQDIIWSGLEAESRFDQEWIYLFSQKLPQIEIASSEASQTSSLSSFSD